jgi:hypothetical protein
MVAIIIIPDALKPFAEQAVKQLSPHSEGESFSVRLFPVDADGAAKPTHWACMPIISEEVHQQIAKLVSSPPFAGVSHLATCEVDDTLEQFAALCNKLGLRQQVDLDHPEVCPACGQALHA